MAAKRLRGWGATVLLVALVLVLCVALAACGGEKKEGAASPSPQAVTISNTIDGKSFDVTYDAAPAKAVSVAGFTTEMLLALGLEESIAGYAYQDNEVLPQYKEAYDKLKNLSKENPSKEVLLSVEPDFLTGWVSAFSQKNFPQSFCDENGIKIYVPKVESPNATMDVVYEDFANYGKIFRVEDRAQKVVEEMKAKIAAVEEKVAGEKPVPVFLYDSGEDTPLTASAGLPTDMIKRAGGKNVFAGTEKNWMDVSWEAVVKAAPEVIIVMQYDASDDVAGKIKFLKKSAALKNVPAVKNNRIFVLGLSDVVAGVRNTTAIEKMAQEFHPSCFK